MVLAVDDFKAKLRGGGARPNLFKATINFPSYAGGDVETTSFLCEAAQLPGSVMTPIVVPFRGRELKIAGDRTFDTWSPTIINDTDFAIRNAMERWMNGINAHTENTGLTAPVDYQVDLLVEQLDRDESVLKTYTFRGCFPTNISPIDLNYGTNNDIERFTVEFQVQYWESNTTS
jgi:hypothetical protein